MAIDIKKGNSNFHVGDEQNPDALMTWTGDDSDTIVIDHTEVSDDLRGQGVGHELFLKVVEYARDNNKKVKATCPFAVAEIKKNKDEVSDVLA